MNEKQELRKWHIHQTVHDEPDDTPGQTFVTTFQGQLKAVPTVSQTTVNRNNFTLGSYTYSHLYSTAYSFRQTFLSRQICLFVSRDMAVWGLIKTANVLISTNPTSVLFLGYINTPKIQAPQGWYVTWHSTKPDRRDDLGPRICAALLQGVGWNSVRRRNKADGICY